MLKSSLLRPRPHQWRALLLGALDLARVELALRRHSLPRLCQRMNVTLLKTQTQVRTSPRSSDAELPNVNQWALAKIARSWPFGGPCLRYSLAICMQLGRTTPGSSKDVYLVLGVRRVSAQPLQAHAWVEHRGHRYDLEPQRATADPQFVPLLRAVGE